MNIFEQVQKSVIDGDLEEAISSLTDFASGRAYSGKFQRKWQEFRIELIIVNTTLNDQRVSARRGLKTDEDSLVQRNQIVSQLLAINIDMEGLSKREDIPVPAERLETDFGIVSSTRLEKLWGRSTIQNISWLEQGLNAARSVCRVVAPNAIGTGFLAGNGTVFTNNHVVSSAQEASKTKLEFNFQEKLDGSIENIVTYQVSSSPDGFFTSKELDVTAMNVIENSSEPSLSTWSKIRFNATKLPAVGDHVSIIQHPQGGAKKISVTRNEVVNLFDHRLHYITDTLPGSSGSPVFNDRWEVLAIHHAGGKLEKNQSGGSIYANEGILFSHIFQLPDLNRKQFY
jgi:V8-like Glu-specific endopeptidase